LRERRGDIELLSRHFLKLSAGTNAAKTLTTAAIARLQDHSWPGNVRELRNTIERAVILVRGNTIDAADLDGVLPSNRGSPRDSAAEGDLPAAVAKLEYDMIRKTPRNAPVQRANQRRNGSRRYSLGGTSAGPQIRAAKKPSSISRFTARLSPKRLSTSASLSSSASVNGCKFTACSWLFTLHLSIT
jgi:hypothetical protein